MLVLFVLDLFALVIVHPEVKNWIKYARFEEKNHFINSARRIYERAMEYFGEHTIQEQLFIAFAHFEEHQKEVSLFSLSRFIIKLMKIFIL